MRRRQGRRLGPHRIHRRGARPRTRRRRDLLRHHRRPRGVGHPRAPTPSAEYNRHIEEVKATVPADRLLVFTVDQGWDPLCRFLGVPVPDTPFPNVNDRAEIKKVIADMSKGAYVILAGLGVVALALLYALIRLAG
ncbi:MAG: hypothetical protein KDK75_15235 [Alphaproteobacteria bacterium]|nr:hypothetical protein [Alphaproteobacteria bacterium]